MTIESKVGQMSETVLIDNLVIAGWAGRDREAMEHHIAELEALGIARPKATPTFYRVSPTRLTDTTAIQATGDSSSGEAEIVIFACNGRHYVGLGSDHTDRKVEAYGVTVSKQMCDKPIANKVWPLEEVMDHWDALILRSHIEEQGQRVLYQDGSVSGLLNPIDLIKRYCGQDRLPDGTAMFCGTMPAIGGVRPNASFAAEVRDPVLGRSIALNYAVASLEDVG